MGIIGGFDAKETLIYKHIEKLLAVKNAALAVADAEKDDEREKAQMALEALLADELLQNLQADAGLQISVGNVAGFLEKDRDIIGKGAIIWKSKEQPDMVQLSIVLAPGKNATFAMSRQDAVKFESQLIASFDKEFPQRIRKPYTFDYRG